MFSVLVPRPTSLGAGAIWLRGVGLDLSCSGFAKTSCSGCSETRSRQVGLGAAQHVLDMWTLYL